MTEDQIRHMVERFLNWQLPRDFNPDGGVVYHGDYVPYGTNLLNYTQAIAMVRHMVEDMPGDSEPEKDKPSNPTPPAFLEYILDMMRNSVAAGNYGTALECAKAAAPFVHPQITTIDGDLHITGDIIVHQKKK